jgi:hypothetical protein
MRLFCFALYLLWLHPKQWIGNQKNDETDGAMQQISIIDDGIVDR